MPFYLWCYVHCYAVPKSWSNWLHPGGGMWLWQLASISRFWQVKYINDHGDFVLFVRRRMILEFCSLWSSLVILSFLLNWWTQYCRCGLAGVQQWGRFTSLDLLAAFLLMQARTLVVIFRARARCWLLFSLVSSRSLELFSADYFWKCC